MKEKINRKKNEGRGKKGRGCSTSLHAGIALKAKDYGDREKYAY